MKVLVCSNVKENEKDYRDILNTLKNREHIPMEILDFYDAKSFLFEMKEMYSTVDLVVIDVNVSDNMGIAMAKQLRSNNYKGEIIFFANDDAEAVSGYDVHAFHYILNKDMTLERKTDIFKEVLNYIDDKEQEFMIFNGIGESRYVKINSIRYFEVQERVITVHYDDDDKTFEFLSRLGKIENQLLSYGFIRIHRSYLIARQYIGNFNAQSVTLIDGTEFPIGRTYMKDVKNYLLNT